MITIRTASLDDTREMARVIVDTWFATHEDQISTEALQKRRDEWGYAESEKGWHRTIQESDGVSTQILVANDEQRVIAVAASNVTGADRAELEVLYVEVDYQRSGTGRRLLEATIDHCCRIGISKLHVAVLAANQPARRFYESLGGLLSGTRAHEDGPEVVYTWDLA